MNIETQPQNNNLETSASKSAQKKGTSQKLALLIPAHNEELVLEATILGATNAGISKRDIYLVDDSSTDKTSQIGVSMLGSKNVLKVERSGKAGAIAQAITHFKLTSRYGWLQILDADSIFSPDYFIRIRKHFRPGVAAVCGQTKSLKNNWITSFRTYEYTISHDLYKSLMGMTNLITIMPGPASCFRMDVVSKLNFATDTLTEDFDLTLQIHHGKLGRIAYEPHAHSWTQDPYSLPMYAKQVSRWYTGFFQVMKKHKVGTQSFRKIDILLLVLALDGLAFMVQIALIAALSIFGEANVDFKVYFLLDFAIMMCLAIYVSLRTKRVDILAPLPLYYILRILNLALFFWAAIKIYLLPQKNGIGTWTNTRKAQSSQLTLSKGGVS